MKLFSGNRLIAGTTIGTAILVSGIASGMKPELQASSQSAQNKAEHHVFYTASGTTDARTAKLFQKLMQDRKNLQIDAVVNRNPKAALQTRHTAQLKQRLPVKAEHHVFYTASGKTDARTAKMFQKLMQNRKNLQIEAFVNRNPKPALQARHSAQLKHRPPAKAEHRVFYTASGKTDVRTAKMFQKLMQNRRNLQIEAVVNRNPKPALQTRHIAKLKQRPLEVAVNYTINGKTDLRTVKKLVRLFKSNRNVEVIAQAKVRVNPDIARVRHGNGPARYAYRQYQPQYNADQSRRPQQSVPTNQTGWNYGYNQSEQIRHDVFPVEQIHGYQPVHFQSRSLPATQHFEHQAATFPPRYIPDSYQGS